MLLGKTFLGERHVPWLPDDSVTEEADAKQLAGLFESVTNRVIAPSSADASGFPLGCPCTMIIAAALAGMSHLEDLTGWTSVQRHPVLRDKATPSFTKSRC